MLGKVHKVQYPSQVSCQIPLSVMIRLPPILCGYGLCTAERRTDKQKLIDERILQLFRHPAHQAKINNAVSFLATTAT